MALRRLIPLQSEPDYSFSFRIARTLYTLLKGFKGEYWLYSMLGKLGKLRRAGRFDYFDGSIYVPLKVPETLYVDDFSLFQGLREIHFAMQLNAQFDQFTLIDCGVYFGQVSMRIARLCPGLEQIVVVDPSVDNCEYSRANLDMTGLPFKVINAAVSDFTGNAVLLYPEGINMPDSAYIEPREDGDFPVAKLDDLVKEHGVDCRSKNIALKLDVEGEELAAIAGATELIREAAKVCYFIELHPEVLQRKKLTAEEVLGSISGIRATRWYLADDPGLELSLDRPVFEQIGAPRICDVIGVTEA